MRDINSLMELLWGFIDDPTKQTLHIDKDDAKMIFKQLERNMLMMRVVDLDAENYNY